MAFPYVVGTEPWIWNAFFLVVLGDLKDVFQIRKPTSSEIWAIDLSRMMFFFARSEKEISEKNNFKSQKQAWKPGTKDSHFKVYFSTCFWPTSTCIFFVPSMIAGIRRVRGDPGWFHLSSQMSYICREGKRCAADLLLLPGKWEKTCVLVGSGLNSPYSFSILMPKWYMPGSGVRSCLVYHVVAFPCKFSCLFANFLEMCCRFPQVKVMIQFVAWPCGEQSQNCSNPHRFKNFISNHSATSFW